VCLCVIHDELDSSIMYLKGTRRLWSNIHKFVVLVIGYYVISGMGNNCISNIV